MMILTCLALRLRLFLKGIDSSSRADISLGQPSIHLRNERTASTSLISGKYSFAKSLRFIFQYFNLTIIFLPHPSSPARRFSKITPVPSLPLKRGSTSPSAPSPQERAPTGKPAVLYSQTSFNCVDFRLRSAEHSSELDALPSLARKFAPFGVARRVLRT